MIGVVRENPEYVSILAQVEVIVNRQFGKKGKFDIGVRGEVVFGRK